MSYQKVKSLPFLITEYVKDISLKSGLKTADLGNINFPA